MKSQITQYVHSCNKGLVYSLRVLHGRVHNRLIKIKLFCITHCMRKKNKVVATAFYGKIYGENPMYIIEKIHELSLATEIVWLRARENKDEIPGFVRTVCYQDREAVKKEIAQASIIIGNTGCFEKVTRRKDQLHIETWHGGLGLKKIGLDATTKISNHAKDAYDFYLSNSDHLTKAYRTAFAYHGPVWKCGYPIEDALLTEDGERQRYRELYHIPQDTRIVLYAPTHRALYRWQCQLNVSHVVDAMQKRFGGEWVMLVHWHPHMRKEDMILDGAVDVTDTTSMQDLVKASDAFISDYSSSIFQAVQRKIPCFIYADDYEAYNMDRGLCYPLSEQPFPYALDEDGLIENILHYDNVLWEEKWKQYAERMGHVVTGHSAEDVARECVDFLNGKPKSEIMNEIPFDDRF